jgi:uncharacterized protein YdaU (DUF1376 family)
MHYYKRNLGDYAKKAGRLTMIQHGAYNLLIDACYDREEFPTLEQAIEWTWSITDEEIEAVKFVLNRFFKVDKEGQYIQDRILQELLEYHEKADKNKQIAVEREAKRKQNSTNRAQPVDESSPNHKPITNNQEPLTINQEPSYIGTVCAAIKKEYDLHKIPLLDMSRDNPSFTACIEAGATVGEFVNAAKISASKGNGFAYLLSIVINERKKAKKLDLHKGNMQQAPNREQGRQIAAKSIFKDEHISHLMGNEIKEVKEI